MAQCVGAHRGFLVYLSGAGLRASLIEEPSDGRWLRPGWGIQGGQGRVPGKGHKTAILFL